MYKPTLEMNGRGSSNREDHTLPLVVGYLGRRPLLVFFFYLRFFPLIFTPPPRANNLVSDSGTLDPSSNCPRRTRATTAAMEYTNASNRQVLEELRLMEARLSEKFAGRCDNIERRVEDIHSHFTTRCDKIQEQVDMAALCSNDRLVALEEMRSDIERWHPDLVKRVEDVTLEVLHVN
jgi:hypothetical protein